MKIRAFLILFFLSPVVPLFADENHKITLFTENYPPYNMSLKGNDHERKKENITGYASEIVKELMSRSGYPYKIKLRNWKYGYSSTQKHDYYGIYSTTRTDARENKFQWVGPLAENNWVLYARKDSSIVLNSIDDAKAYKVGGYKGDAASEFLKSQGLAISQLPEDRFNAQRLAEKQIDLWISGNLSAYYIAKKEGFTGIKPVFTVKKTQLYIAFNKQFSEEKIRTLQSILEQMRNEGYLNKVKENYR